MRKLFGSLIVAGALGAGGLVYAQQAGEPNPENLPDPLAGIPAPHELPDPLAGLPPPEEAPPAEGVPGAPPPSQALTAAENQASTDLAAQVAEEVDPEDLEPPPPPPPPLKRPRHQTAILQAVDKVTAETLRFEAKVGQPVRYKTLVFTLRACETTAEDENYSDQLAHVEVTSQPKSGTGREQRAARQVFRGWMSANSAGLNPLEHSVYDAWLIACKASEPVRLAGAE